MGFWNDLFDPLGMFRDDGAHQRSIEAGMNAQTSSQKQYHEALNQYIQGRGNAYQQYSGYSSQSDEPSKYDLIYGFVHIPDGPKKPENCIDAEFEVVEVKLLDNTEQ